MKIKVRKVAPVTAARTTEMPASVFFSTLTAQDTLSGSATALTAFNDNDSAISEIITGINLINIRIKTVSPAAFLIITLPAIT